MLDEPLVDALGADDVAAQAVEVEFILFEDDGQAFVAVGIFAADPRFVAEVAEPEVECTCFDAVGSLEAPGGLSDLFDQQLFLRVDGLPGAEQIFS